MVRENLDQTEKQHIRELEAMGFDIDYVLDSTGHLYKMHLVLPWYYVNVVPEYQGKFKPTGPNAIDLTLNKAKNLAVSQSSSFIHFMSKSWHRERDFDKVMVELVEFMKHPNTGSPIVSFNFNMTPEQKNDRRIDGNLSAAINSLW